MTYEEFKAKLKENNLDMAVWAEYMGLSYRGVTNWKATEVPVWVDKYFEVYEENKKAKELKVLLKDFCEKL
jgi:hypothetical protein